jgi:uncharacterized cupin superfamily protein
MPKIDLSSVPVRAGSSYPPPFDEPCRSRENRALGVAVGLTQFGVNITRLPPGAWSSQRHWHEREDEFVWVLSGEVVLVTDAGEQVLRPGDCAGFAAGVRDGHHFINRSDAAVELLTVGSRDDADHGEYSDIDMVFRAGRYQGGNATFARKDGRPY